jgi:hypothetical protein
VGSIAANVVLEALQGQAELMLGNLRPAALLERVVRRWLEKQPDHAVAAIPFSFGAGVPAPRVAVIRYWLSEAPIIS